MGFRFRKSIGLPGLKLNVSKTGLSVTAGVPGAHVNYDLSNRRKNPAMTTVGLPGTGLSYRSSVGAANSGASSSVPPNAVIDGIIAKRAQDDLENRAEEIRTGGNEIYRMQVAELDNSSLEYLRSLCAGPFRKEFLTAFHRQSDTPDFVYAPGTVGRMIWDAISSYERRKRNRRLTIIGLLVAGAAYWVYDPETVKSILMFIVAIPVLIIYGLFSRK
jgi:hypothetical protein